MMFLKRNAGSLPLKSAIISSFIFFIFLMLFCSAASADIIIDNSKTSTGFTVSTEESIDVCSCSQISDTILITNTGDFDASFSIAKNLDYVILSEQSFFLKSKESRLIRIYSKQICDEISDTLVLSVSSNLGKSITAYKILNVGLCNNLKSALVASSDSINPCEPVYYKIFIQNTGAFSETYTLSAEKYSEYINATSNEVVLLPNQVAEINATLNLECSDYGKFDIPFIVHSKNTNLVAELTHVLDVKRNFEYTIEYNDYNLACIGEESTIWFDITNNVVTPNRYKIMVNSDGLKINAPGEILLNSFEKKRVDLKIINPDKYKNHQIKVSVVDDLGQVKKEFTLNTEAAYCHDLKISYKLPDQKSDFCPAVYNGYFIDFYNNGRFDEEISVDNSGSNVIDFSETEFTIKPTESKRIEFTLRVKDTDYLDNITINTNSFGKLIQTKSFPIKGLSAYSCNKLVPIESKKTIRLDESKVSFKIKNTGKFKNTYLIISENPSWINVETTELELNSGEEKWINFNIDKSGSREYKDYQVNIVAQTMTGNNQFEIPLIITLRDKNLFEKAYEYIFYNILHLIIFLILLLILILLIILIIIKIRAPKYPYKMSSRIAKYSKLMYSFIALWLLVALLIVLIFGIPDLPQAYHAKTNSSQLYFEWPEGKTYTVNLSMYYSDPDKDILVYSAENTPNVEIKIKNEMATFIPRSGYFGKESVVFVATDTAGVTTFSDPMTISVVEVNYPKFSEYVYAFRYYLILIPLFIILAIIFFMVIFANTRPITGSSAYSAIGPTKNIRKNRKKGAD